MYFASFLAFQMAIISIISYFLNKNYHKSLSGNKSSFLWEGMLGRFVSMFFAFVAIIILLISLSGLRYCAAITDNACKRQIFASADIFVGFKAFTLSMAIAWFFSDRFALYALATKYKKKYSEVVRDSSLNKLSKKYTLYFLILNLMHFFCYVIFH